MSEVTQLIPRQEQASDKPRLETESGAWAECKGQALRVYSRRNELIFEYDPENEKARVMVEKGDLELATREGDIRLNSARDILMEGQRVELVGRSGLRMAVQDAVGLVQSALSLDPQRLGLRSAELNVTAKRAELSLADLRYLGQRVQATVQRGKLMAEKLETVAQTIVEKAKNTYRTVEELSQLKSGRLRTLVAGSLHIKAKKSILKSDEDFKIKAEKIHLG